MYCSNRRFCKYRGSSKNNLQRHIVNEHETAPGAPKNQNLSVRLQPSLQSNPAISNLWLLILLNSYLILFSCCWGPIINLPNCSYFQTSDQKSSLTKYLPFFNKEAKSSFTNRKWNYPNRKWNFFSYFQTSDQKNCFNKIFTIFTKASK